MLTVTYTECHILAPNAECLYAECRYAKRRYAECRGAVKGIITNTGLKKVFRLQQKKVLRDGDPGDKNFGFKLPS